MKVILKKMLVAVMIFALLAGGLAVPSQQACAVGKVTISKKAKVTVGKTAKIQLKNNKKKVKWIIVKGKKNIKLTKKTKTYVKIKGVNNGIAKVAAKIGKKRYVCTITVTGKKKNSYKDSGSQSTDHSTVPNIREESRPTVPTITKIPEDDQTSTPTASAIMKTPTPMPTEPTIPTIPIITKMPETDQTSTPTPTEPTISIEDLTPKTIVYDGTNKDKIKYSSNPVLMVVEDGVESIEYYEFNNCENLISVTLSNTVTNIGEQAFYGCSNLTNVTLSNALISIGRQAFYGCSSLTNIVIPDTVTNIGESAFEECSNLNTIQVSEKNETYDSRNQCNAIIESSSNALILGCSSSVIPNTVTSIGDRAFYKCNGITNIIIPDGMETIGEDAFQGCENLTDIKISDSVTTIKSGAFGGCRNLTNIMLSNSLTCIDEFVFNACSNLTSIIIPNSVTSIKKYAFWGCEKLNDIIIPDSVTSIGYEVFADCISLTSIVIPASVIGSGCALFDGCDNLVSIKVAEDNPVYDSRNDCNAIIETSKNKLIAGCSSTVIPNSVTSIGELAFCDNNALTNITIPDSVTRIGDYAFVVCENLASMVIPDSVTYIGESAFRQCSNLKKIVISDSVSVIGEYAFEDCTNLEIIEVTAGNTIFDSRNHCNAIIKTAENKLLIGCSGTVIPDSVTSIEMYAFSGSGLTDIVIPNSVTSIGSCAFSNCNNVNCITFPDDFIVDDWYDYFDDDILVQRIFNMDGDNLTSITWRGVIYDSIDSFSDAYANR